MKQKLFSILALLLVAATGAKAETVTWTASDMTDLSIDFNVGSAAHNTIKSITVTASSGGMGGWQANNISMDEGSTTITFTSSVGNIKSIEITAHSIYSYGDTPSGWTLSNDNKKLSWSGDASPTVSMTLSDWSEFSNISEIVFTIESAPATTYSVTMAEGTEDGDKWTVKVGEGEAQAFPAEGLKGGETVTATYSGDRKVKSVKAVKKAPADPLAVPLTIEAITAGSITVSNLKAGMQYSLDGGATKNAVTTDEIVLNPGDKVQFYGNGTSITSYGGSSSSDCTKIDGSGYGFTCKVYGNIMSLVDEKNFATAKTLSEAYAFSFLFYNNPTLTDASGLLLPATTLGDNCYNRMFSYCTSLTAAPALPATQLAASCYSQMFRGCTALTTAPVLPAETLVERCYYQMFYQCSKLATVTCLATSGIGQSNSTNQWLQSAGNQVQGAKFVYTSSSANWPTSNNGIPSGWQREDIN